MLFVSVLEFYAVDFWFAAFLHSKIFRNFDTETLMPPYKLIIGKAGESNALWISRKMGMREKVLKMAEKYIKERGSNEHSMKFQIDDDLKLPKQKKTKENMSSEGENNTNENGKGLSIGDSVIIKSSNERGIIYQLEDDYGDCIFNSVAFFGLIWGKVNNFA